MPPPPKFAFVSNPIRDNVQIIIIIGLNIKNVVSNPIRDNVQIIAVFGKYCKIFCFKPYKG